MTTPAGLSLSASAETTTAARLMMGLGKPRRVPTVRGSDMAGQVAAVGRNVTRFRPGDEVFAEVGTGGCAEYISVPEEPALKPANLTFEQAAAVPMAAQTALVGVRDHANVQPGQKVLLINGASGGVGTFAVQVAKAFGAEVTGVCSTRNVDMVRSLGADHVIDYTQQDFTQSERRYDFILDTVGNHSMSECRRVLSPKGTYGAPGAGGGRWLGAATQQLKAALLSPFVSQTMVLVNDKPNQDLDYLKGLIEAGKVTPRYRRHLPAQSSSRRYAIPRSRTRPRQDCDHRGRGRPMTIRTVAEMAIECSTPPERVATGYQCRTDRSQSDRRWLTTVVSSRGGTHHH